MDDLLKNLQTNFYDMLHNIVENKQKSFNFKSHSEVPELLAKEVEGIANQSFNELEIEVINDFLNERQKHYDTNRRI
tara:strand:+ start:505 stop:735 length:231 start_codon:yes stop_codon:yes gene_type:complete